MTRKRELIVQTLPTWKENIIAAVAWCLGIKGMPVGFLYAEVQSSSEEPTINDLIRNQEESSENRVRKNN